MYARCGQESMLATVTKQERRPVPVILRRPQHEARLLAREASRVARLCTVLSPARKLYYSRWNLLGRMYNTVSILTFFSLWYYVFTTLDYGYDDRNKPVLFSSVLGVLTNRIGSTLFI